MSSSQSRDLPRLSARFLTSAARLAQCPADSGTEVAFAGRSNAGKSSVLNRLTGSRRTAKVSKQPGRTRLLNFFEVAADRRLVDLPGYGYARAEKRAQAEWQAVVNAYLSERESLVGLVLVMDIRHPLMPFDRELVDWSDASALPLRILLNKADKLGRGAQSRTLADVQRSVAERTALSVQCFSAQTGQGVRELIDWIEERLDQQNPDSGSLTD